MLNKLLCLTYFISSVIVLTNEVLPRILLKEIAAFLMLKGIIWMVLYRKQDGHEWLNVFFGVYLMMLSFGYNSAFLTGSAVIFLMAETIYHTWLKAYLAV